MDVRINEWSNARYYIFLYFACVFGIAQGFLIPMVATLLEQQHLSPSMNGLSTAVFYLGMLCSMLLYTKMIERWGYRTTIMLGIALTLVAVVIFPFTTGVWMWSILRFFVGAGSNIAFLPAQVWLMATVKAEEKGKRLALFGLMYGLGFGIGPLGLQLTVYHEFLPFILLIVLLIIAFVLTYLLHNGKATFATVKGQEGISNSYFNVYLLGYLALIPMLLYGFLEVAISGNFPVYGLKIGLSKAEISLLITTFVWGSLLLQIPLGVIGDKIGRKMLLRVVCSIGGICLLCVPLLGNHFSGIFALFAITGGFVGSLYSLGLAYMDDILPSHFIPKASALGSMHYSVGSMVGPYLGGVLMQYTGLASLFTFLGASLLAFVILTFVSSVKSLPTEKISG